MGDYAGQILKIAVSVLCDDNDFKRVHKSTLKTLTDVTRRYIEMIGALAAQNAEHALRTEPSILDVDQAFDSLGINWAELAVYHEKTLDMVFPMLPPKFPQPRRIIMCQGPTERVGGDEDGEGWEDAGAGDDVGDEKDSGEPKDPSRSHIPDYLPRFPPARTFRATPGLSEREKGASVKRKGAVENKTAERLLVAIHDKQDKEIVLSGVPEGASDSDIRGLFQGLIDRDGKDDAESRKIDVRWISDKHGWPDRSVLVEFSTTSLAKQALKTRTYRLRGVNLTATQAKGVPRANYQHPMGGSRGAVAP